MTIDGRLDELLHGDHVALNLHNAAVAYQTLLRVCADETSCRAAARWGLLHENSATHDFNPDVELASSILGKNVRVYLNTVLDHIARAYLNSTMARLSLPMTTFNYGSIPDDSIATEIEGPETLDGETMLRWDAIGLAMLPEGEWRRQQVRNAANRWQEYHLQPGLYAEKTTAPLWHLWRIGPDGHRFSLVLAVGLASQPSSEMVQLHHWKQAALPLFFGQLPQPYAPVIGPDQRLRVGGKPSYLYVEPIPSLPAEILEQLIRANLHRLPTHRLIPWLSNQAFRSYFETATDEDRERGIVLERQAGGAVRIEVQGGLQALAEAVGSTSARDGRILLDSLRAMTGVCVRFRGPDREVDTHLITELNYVRGGPGKPSVLSFQLSHLWSPGQGHGLGQLGFLVPTLPVPRLPEGLEVHHPKLATLDTQARCKLTENSMELMESAGIRINWSRLAESLDLPMEVVRTALALWQEDTVEHPARWKEVEPGRWMHGDAFQSANALIRESAEIRGKAQRNGRKTANRKRPTRK